MTIKGIKKMRTETSVEELEDMKAAGAIAFHESIYRSYQTLEYIKECLRRWDSVETILDIIQVIEQD